MRYVDGFVLPIPRKSMKAYRKLAELAKRVWMEHGALAYRECVGEELKVGPGCGLAFPKGIRSRAGEAIVFAYIEYKSKAHRNAVNRRVMADARLSGVPETMPFDMKRMMHGGFQAIVESR